MAKELNDDKSPAIISFTYKQKLIAERESSLQVGDTMSSEDVRNALNRAPRMFAYWSNLLNQVKQDLRAKEDAFEFWMAEKLSTIMKDHPKLTSDTARRAQASLTYIKEYKPLKAELNELHYVEDQLSTLVKTYEMQSKTLQSIGSLLRKEMDLTD